MTKWATFILAAVGLTIGVYTAATATREAPRVPLAGEPSVNPFAHGVAASGLVEAASRNIPVAPPESGLVSRVFVEVGQRVKVNDPLFELDPRPLRAELIKAEAAQERAGASLARLRAQPRPETIPPLEAAVASAGAEVEDLRSRLARWEAVGDPRAVNQDELDRVRFGLEAARGRLEQARANLALAQAGTWSEDLKVAEAELSQARAQVEAVQVLIDRRTARAPVEGTVLKRNLEPGQFAAAESASLQQGSIVVGDLSKLHIRARVDEEDLPLLRAGARGVARIRGGVGLTASLAMLRIEPLAVPKTTLSGDTTERVDTRVLEVVFEVTGPTGSLPLYPGQLVDVFIEGGEPPAP